MPSPDATNESPDVDALLAASTRELELADVAEPESLDDGPPPHPFDDGPCHYQREQVDGEWLRVPQGDEREAFIAEHRERRQAERDADAALQAEIDRYLQAGPLERARLFTEREQVAIEKLLVDRKDLPV